MKETKELQGPLTQKEWDSMQKNHPAITYESCRVCGGYQTVMREFDKWYMEIDTECNQCGAKVHMVFVGFPSKREGKGQ